MPIILNGDTGVIFPAGGVANPAGAVVGTTDVLTLTNKTLIGAVMNGTVGATTPASGAFTTITASSTLDVTGVATLGNGAILGTPASGVLTNVTGTASGLTAGNVTTNANLTGMVTSVGNAATVVTNANLTGAITSVGNATSLGSFTSAQLATALTDETGTGAAVFATSPTLVTPALGTPASGTVTNLTGTASININGTVGATTPAAGAFTTVSASGNGAFSGVLQVAPTTGTGIIGVGDNFGGGMNAGIYRGGVGVTTTGNYLNVGGYDGVVITVGAAALGSQTVRAAISSTGLAVTGAISATGEATVGSVALGDGNIVQWGAGTATYIQGNQASQFVNTLINSTIRASVTSTGLAVTGAISASGTISANNGASSIQVAGQVNFNSTNVGLYRQPATDALEIGGSGGVIARFNNAGSLAVTGTLTSTGDILLNGSANPSLTVKTSGAGNNPFIRIQADTNYWDLQSIFSNSTDDLDIRYNGSSRLNITSAGNVGIGTTNPTETLHVSGTNIRIDGTSGEAGVYMYRSNNNAPDVRFYSSSGSIASPTAKPNGGLVGQIHWHGHDGTSYQDRAGIYGTVDGAVSTGTVPIALRFFTGTSSLVETMRITSSGNVGIGTTSLAGLKLVALGASGYPATTGVTQTGVLRLTGGTGLYNVLDMGVNESTDTAWMQATRANSLGTYDKLAINPYGGNVGIGTTGPGRILHLSATGGDAALLRIQSTGSDVAGIELLSGHGNWGVYNSDTVGDALEFRDDSAGSTRMIIDSTGNVGIGTTAPSTGFAGAISNVKLAIRGGTHGAAGGVATMLIGADNNHYAAISGTHTGGGETYLSLSTSASVSNPIERMRINSAGIVTMPYQPAFYTAGTGGSTAYGNGGEFILTNVQTNIGSNYSSSTGRFTAPVAGFYSFTYATYNYGAAAQISFKKNGSDYVVGDTSGLNTVAPSYISGTAFMLYLAANDTASFGWRQGYSGNIYHAHSWFSGHLVG